MWLVCFWGYFSKATAYTLEGIFTQNTSQDVVRGKEVPLGGPADYVLYLDPYISEKSTFWDIFSVDIFFGRKLL